MKPLTLAVPKGRVTRSLVELFERAGIPAAELLADDRRLRRESDDGSLSFLLLKPDDVPTYVEYGAADLGVSGRDVLLERRYDLYQPLDLGIGRCRMVVAGPKGVEPPAAPRVATKYARIASDHFARRGVPAEVIYVQGSVELAPLVGLSHLIVDLVETGTTLVENGLEERERVADVSSLLVANRAQYKLRHAEVRPLIERLRKAATEGDSAAFADEVATQGLEVSEVGALRGHETLGGEQRAHRVQQLVVRGFQGASDGRAAVWRQVLGRRQHVSRNGASAFELPHPSASPARSQELAVGIQMHVGRAHGARVGEHCADHVLVALGEALALEAAIGIEAFRPQRRADDQITRGAVPRDPHRAGTPQIRERSDLRVGSREKRRPEPRCFAAHRQRYRQRFVPQRGERHHRR